MHQSFLNLKAECDTSLGWRINENVETEKDKVWTVIYQD